MEFQIPLSREDLLRPSGGSQFFVSEPLPAREVVSRLEGRSSNVSPPPCPSLPPSSSIIHPNLSYIVLPFLLCLCGLFDNVHVGHPIYSA